METMNDLSTLDQRLEENKLALIYVSMPQCSVCHAVRPQVDTLGIKHDLPIFHIDAWAVPEVAGRFEILTAPVVLLFQDGKELERQARFIDFHHLQTTIQQAAGADEISYEDLFM